LSLVTAQSFEWAKGGIAKTNVNNLGMGMDSLGNLYTLCRFSDTVFFENKMIIPPYNNDYYSSKNFIVKIDSSGKWLWSTTIWGQYSIGGHDISVAPNGDFVVVGSFYQSIHFGSGSDTISLYSSSFNREPFIAKYNLDGILLFAIQGRGSGTEMGAGESLAKSVELFSNGEFIVTGFFRDSVRFGNITLVSSSLDAFHDRNLFLVKFNSEGQVLWGTSASQPQHHYDDGWILYPIDLCSDKEGNIFLTAELNGVVRFNDSSNNITIYKEIGYLTNTALLVKYDSNGKLLWAKTEGGDARIDPKGVACDKEGNLYFTGSFWYKNPIFGSYELMKSLVAEAFIVKFDTESNVLWAKQTHSSLSSIGGGIAVDNDGNVFITGGFKGNTTLGEGTSSVTITSPEQQEIFIAKFNKEGSLVWVNQSRPRTTWGAGGSGSSISVDNYKNCFVSGFYITPITFDNITLPAMSGNEIFIAKVKDEKDIEVPVKELPSDGILSVFPNPSNSNFTLSYKGVEGIIYIKVRNLTGAIIYEIRAQANTGAFLKQIELGNQAPGVYFLELTTGIDRIVKKVIISK
jgi:hypothetical protein